MAELQKSGAQAWDEHRLYLQSELHHFAEALLVHMGADLYTGASAGVAVTVRAEK